VDIEGAKLIMIETSGHKKTHYAIVLACCADGLKLPSLLIFKKTMHSDNISQGIFIYFLAKGWMDKVV
jgi:hypothetical protein